MPPRFGSGRQLGDFLLEKKTAKEKKKENEKEKEKETEEQEQDEEEEMMKRRRRRAKRKLVSFVRKPQQHQQLEHLSSFWKKNGATEEQDVLDDDGDDDDASGGGRRRRCDDDDDRASCWVFGRRPKATRRRLAFRFFGDSFSKSTRLPRTIVTRLRWIRSTRAAVQSIPIEFPTRSRDSFLLSLSDSSPEQRPWLECLPDSATPIEATQHRYF